MIAGINASDRFLVSAHWGCPAGEKNAAKRLSLQLLGHSRSVSVLYQFYTAHVEHFASLSLNLLHAWRRHHVVDGPLFRVSGDQPGHKLATGCHEYSITTYSRRSDRPPNGRSSAPNVIRQCRDAIFTGDGETHVQHLTTEERGVGIVRSYRTSIDGRR